MVIVLAMGLSDVYHPGMSKEHLLKAAAKAGITEEQAIVLITNLLHPTTQQCERADQCGGDSIPPFVWPKDLDPESRTHGENGRAYLVANTAILNMLGFGA